MTLLFVGKAWSEAIQLRDDHGRFAGTTGGGGGGGTAAGTVEENPYVAGRDLGGMENIPKGEWGERIGDPRLADAMQAQGYFSPGNVYSKEQMDGFVKAGEIEMLRGTSKEKYAMDMIDSKGSHPYTGVGVHGNGLYAAGVKGDPKAMYDQEVRRLGPFSSERAANTAFNATGVNTAIDYTGIGASLNQPLQGGMIRMTFRPEAKIIKQVDLLNAIGDSDKISEFDLGRIATVKGYDAISVPRKIGPEHYVILNRSALRIQDRPWKVSDYLPDFAE